MCVRGNNRRCLHSKTSKRRKTEGEKIKKRNGVSQFSLAVFLLMPAANLNTKQRCLSQNAFNVCLKRRKKGTAYHPHQLCLEAFNLNFHQSRSPCPLRSIFSAASFPVWELWLVFVFFFFFLPRQSEIRPCACCLLCSVELSCSSDLHPEQKPSGSFLNVWQQD